MSTITHSLQYLYIDEISKFIERLDGSGTWLAGAAKLILLYANDIVLISNSIEGSTKVSRCFYLHFVRKEISIELWQDQDCATMGTHESNTRLCRLPRTML